MKSFTVTIEHTVITRQIVTVEAPTKHDAAFLAGNALSPDDWTDVSVVDRVVGVEAE